MPTRKVGAKVELSGEKLYKQAISELNAANKTMRAEMSRLKTEYEGNAKSSEYLTKQSGLLRDMLQNQQEKVKTLQEAVAHAASEYGEGSTKTQAYATSLAKAQEEEIKLQRALDATNDELSEAVRQEETLGDTLEDTAGATQEATEALDEQNEEMVGLGDTVDSLASKFGINLPNGITEALNGMKGFSAESVAALGAIAAGVAMAIKAMKELYDTTIAAAADVDELIAQSMITGLSTKTLQELQYAENLIDVSVDTITGSLTKLTRNMVSARDGNSSMAESFADLGVSITDTNGNLRSAEAVFYDLIDALGQVENPTERDALAMELFGKSAQDLNPLILQGSDALRELQ